MEAEPRRVLVYGDSLTFGAVPVERVIPTTRYPRDQRWTGVLGAQLGPGYEIVEEGLGGRTTDVDDPLDPVRLNGAAHLPTILASHIPLDLVVIMLGTNDFKWYFHREPEDIALGVGRLIDICASSDRIVGTLYPAPQVLLVAPPPLGDITNPWAARLFEGGLEKSRGYAQALRDLASFLGIRMVDAGEFFTTDGADGIHFTAENNLALGKAVAAAVREILPVREALPVP
ncbi:SGNH/GDSL hydrolase family protein [Streptomyces sp. CA-249302]|uniref:SGNH/GDSL hydrolase family protein n=1 Tax=Streptomyces sp. CA-249302 TaxID=3240058 RepID=UPI003D8A28D5